VKRSQSARKAELMAKAERMIDELLAWEEGADKQTFAEIEAEVMRVRKQMDEAMMTEVVTAQGEEIGAPLCEHCGRKMEHKGRQKQKIGGWTGEVHLSRAYYTCPHCEKGVFSP